MKFRRAAALALAVGFAGCFTADVPHPQDDCPPGQSYAERSYLDTDPCSRAYWDFRATCVPNPPYAYKMAYDPPLEEPLGWKRSACLHLRLPLQSFGLIK